MKVVCPSTQDYISLHEHSKVIFSLHIMCGTITVVTMSQYARNLGSLVIFKIHTHRNNMVTGYKFAYKPPNCDIIIIHNKYVIIIM